MALSMLARIVGGAEGADARARALAIAASLDDEALRLRFTGGSAAPPARPPPRGAPTGAAPARAGGAHATSGRRGEKRSGAPSRAEGAGGRRA
jgi:hypothetical protein